MKRPEPGEVAPYFERYVHLVPDGDIIDILEEQCEESGRILGGLSQEEAGFSYAPGKWSIRQILCHVIDTERVFMYRALRFARGDTTPLPGFDQDAFVAALAPDSRSLASLLREFVTLRASTITLLAGLSEAESTKTGVASDALFSVRGIAYVVAGHEIHHRNVILERYLTGRS